VKKCGRPGEAIDDNIIRRMSFACWITKATKTHSECVILTALPRQKWLHKRVSMLRYTSIVCLALHMDCNSLQKEVFVMSNI
jgi:endonuclease III